MTFKSPPPIDAERLIRAARAWCKKHDLTSLSPASVRDARTAALILFASLTGPRRPEVVSLTSTNGSGGDERE